MGLDADQIILSCKVSGVQDLVAVYRALANRCEYALHLGLTEAGMGAKGIVASSAALSGSCCRRGLHTIRVSLTPAPGEHGHRRSWSRPRSCRPWACARLYPA